MGPRGRKWGVQDAARRAAAFFQGGEGSGEGRCVRPFQLSWRRWLPQGRVTSGLRSSEGLGRCRGQAPWVGEAWVGTSVMVASLGAGGESGLVETWGAVYRSGQGDAERQGGSRSGGFSRATQCSAGLGPQLSTLERGKTVGESVSSSAVGRGPALAARAELTSGLPGAPASLSPQLLLSRLSALPRDGSSAVASRAWRLNSGQGREATQAVSEAWMVRLGMGQGGPCPLQAASRGPSSQSPL